MGKLPFDPEVVENQIKSIIRAIHEDEDPIELTEYKRFIKRHTSVFNRAYVAAYLLKHASPGSQRRSSKSARSSASSTPSPSSGGGSRNEEDPNKTSVFVSIGRSKRVRPGDLVTFFTSVDGLTNDDLGQIKVLDNYSFVEVAKEKASSAIDKLNGAEFRGRKLTVNFARRK